MGYRMLLSFILLVAGLLLCSVARASNITYRVVPYTLGNQDVGQYHFTGTITTDGTLGDLYASNFVDYEITVAGSVPYAFSPTSPGAYIYIDELDPVWATSTELSIVFGDLAFVARDNSSPQCSDCAQTVSWRNVEILGLSDYYRAYSHRDLSDSDPSVELKLEGPWPGFLVARVPEPTTLFLLLGSVTLAGKRLRR